jgi:hypothetical protein
MRVKESDKAEGIFNNDLFNKLFEEIPIIIIIIIRRKQLVKERAKTVGEAI